jgi:predicted O-methyltransferase YrrM
MTLEQLEQRIAAVAPPRRPDPFSRQLSYEQLMLLFDRWRTALRLEACEKSHIRYWHQRLVHIEQLCAGRLAGDIQDAILRVMVAVATPGPNFRMLEIGTLFGVNAAATWDIAACVHDTATVTIIDPLDGYYGAARDVATGLQIKQQTVERNLRVVGVLPEQMRIIPGLSESPDVIAQVKNDRFNYMFIDGDHSYDGMRRDWANYGPLLDAGGYVVFDNYQDQSWPEVTRAVDDLIAEGTLEYLGCAWRSAVFRKPE